MWVFSETTAAANNDATLDDAGIHIFTYIHCVHCKELKKSAYELFGKEICKVHDGIRVYNHDYSPYNTRSLKKLKYQVVAYPTICFKKDGAPPQNYNGARTSLDISTAFHDYLQNL